MSLKAPFPYFGGKSRVADLVWARFGDVQNYVEPFFGSGAVLLGRPDRSLETVNDKDAYIANFWRALQHDPDAVAHYADWPVNENDQHARHLWLVTHGWESVERLNTDPDYYDAKVAGWWVWGMGTWIGSGWCAGPLSRQLPHLGDNGQGVHRQIPHLGDDGRGVHRKLPHLGPGSDGSGINTRFGKERLGGVEDRSSTLQSYMRALADRLRDVRVCCGDWSRVLGPSVTFKHGLTAVFLDPPYGDVGRHGDLYGQDDLAVAAKVAVWARENGDNPLLRIALCGYEGEHAMPGWAEVGWSTSGGFASQGSNGDKNKKRETIWFSPHCQSVDLFSWAAQ